MDGGEERCAAASCSSPQGWQEHVSHGSSPLILGDHTQAASPAPALHLPGPPRAAFCRVTADSQLGHMVKAQRLSSHSC